MKKQKPIVALANDLFLSIIQEYRGGDIISAVYEESILKSIYTLLVQPEDILVHTGELEEFPEKSDIRSSRWEQYIPSKKNLPRPRKVRQKPFNPEISCCGDEYTAQCALHFSQGVIPQGMLPPVVAVVNIGKMQRDGFLLPFIDYREKIHDSILFGQTQIVLQAIVPLLHRFHQLYQSFLTSGDYSFEVLEKDEYVAVERPLTKNSFLHHSTTSK